MPRFQAGGIDSVVDILLVAQVPVHAFQAEGALGILQDLGAPALAHCAALLTQMDAVLDLP